MNKEQFPIAEDLINKRRSLLEFLYELERLQESDCEIFLSAPAHGQVSIPMLIRAATIIGMMNIANKCILDIEQKLSKL